MRVLFDNGTPRGVGAALTDHIVEEARAHYQQNLAGRKIAIIVRGNGRWRLIKNRLPTIGAAVAAAEPGSLAEIEIPID
jgi:hypothetical protein